MLRSTLCTLLAGLGLMGLGNSAHAQHYVPHTSTHIDYVPHTTTHFDEVRHGNHYDFVPHTTTHLDVVTHTTTHLDAVPYTSHRMSVGGYSAYQSHRPVVVVPQYSYRPSVRHTTTHLDVVPHHGHVHIVPHTTTRRYH
ncbi:MAG: hypothetical protein NTY15_08820 [Planctomycetota bacterium]|nr:hypothetical protein [Planctomycetota bacterium]